MPAEIPDDLAQIMASLATEDAIRAEGQKICDHITRWALRKERELGPVLERVLDEFARTNPQRAAIHRARRDRYLRWLRAEEDRLGRP
jgi:hypothetical protein